MLKGAADFGIMPAVVPQELDGGYEKEKKSVKLKVVLMCLGLAASLVVSAAEVRSLDGLWEFAFDKGGRLESANPTFAATDKMSVPGCFDMTPRYYNRRGLAHYRRAVTLDRAVADARIRVKGMGLAMRLFVDGRAVGESHLPWSTVEFAVGPLSVGRHEIVAALDNRLTGELGELFQPFYDFYASGGFYHGVDLVLQDRETEIDRVFVRTQDYRTGKVELELVFSGTARPTEKEFAAMVSFDDGAPERVLFTGRRATLTVPNFRLWSPESPALHRVTVAADGYGEKTERFGIREIKAEKKRILLNGREIYLTGVNRHEAHPEFGYATSLPLMMEDIQLMKDLGCNYVRGAHYPQTEEFLNLCDEVGLMVWEESLGWGNGPANLTNEVFIARQVEQTRLMVRNSFNHPSIIIYGFMNEMASDLPVGRDLIKRLTGVVRHENSGRLVTWACNRPMGDLGNEFTDIIAYNTYPGWCWGDDGAIDEETLQKTMRDETTYVVNALRKKFGEEKPIIVSEMGTCAVYGQRDRDGAQWTEEFESQYVGAAIRAVFENPEVRGFTVWQFADSRSYFRGGASIRSKPFAMNLAGLFDGYRREKLAAQTVRKLFQSKIGQEK